MKKKYNNKKKSLKVIPLGGLDEIGKNITVFEYGKNIVIVDCGLAFPDEEMLGIDVVIPDFSYLKRNQDRIRGIVLTHGHLDHIGAVPYLLKKFNVPVFGSKLTLGLLKTNFENEKDISKYTFNEVKAGETVNLGCFQVEFIESNHSIPDAMSLCLHTPEGKVIHTGDFKIDYTPIGGNTIDLSRFAQLGSEGVLLLMADSTNAERPGNTMSESTVGKTFEDIFRHADGRIIVASFSSNVYRVQQILNASLIYNRKVAFSGRSMVNVSNVAMELGYLKVAKDMIIDIDDIDKYPDNEIVVITTGSQGEPMSALPRMCSNRHRHMTIRPSDLVILSSTPIPGNEKSVKKIIDDLMRLGANVIFHSLADVHVSGHACQEELKVIHALVKPKYFMPVHGEYSHLRTHGMLAKKMGMSGDNIFIMENGEILEFKNQNASLSGSVQTGETLVDGLGIGDVGNIVLRDRKKLSNDGLIIVLINMDKETKEFDRNIDIISRGFVYVRESFGLINNSKKVIVDELDTLAQKNVTDWSTIKYKVRKSLGDHLYKTLKRNPMILTVINEI